MNWYSIFYWLTVASNAKSFFWFFAIVLSIIAIIAFCSWAIYNTERNSETEVKASRKWFFWSLPFAMLMWAGIVFTPCKKDAVLIVAGGATANFLTSDSTAKAMPHDIMVFLQTEIRALAEDAKVEISEAKAELKAKNAKEKILDEAKNMTRDQILEKMKVDTSFRNVILNN
jgi:hypothetical protein